MHSSRIFLGCFIVALLALPSQAENWTRFRGPNGTGVADGQNIPVEFGPDKNLLWKVAIPGIGNSCPVIFDKHLFLQSASKDGKERMFYCLDAATGKTLWHRSFPGINVKVREPSSLASATAAVDADGVYIPIWDGTTVSMVAYTHTGELLWSKNLGKWISQHGTGSSPVLVGDKLIFALDGDVKDMKGNPLAGAVPPALMAFNKKTGDLVWETPREGFRASYSIPFLLDRPGKGPELVVTSTMAITSYNPDTGKAVWNFDWQWEKNNFKMPLRTLASSVTGEGILIATSGDGGGDRRMVALALQENGPPTVVWGNGNKVFPYVPCPLVRGSHVYFVSELGNAGCYELKSGKQVWRERLPGGTFFASPVMIDGKIYAPSMEGDIFVLNAEPSFKLLAQNTLGERFVSSPAVADGRLYLRGQNHLFCVGAKK